jgi:16S rRNA (guanine527-N7)-methyltransferase
MIPASLEAILPEVDAFLDLLFEWSRAVRLTAFRDRHEAMAKGVLPSLEALPLLPPGAFAALDVGTGGGFPAVTLALARRDIRWTLTEPSGRKAAFLREAGRVLALPWEVREETAESALSQGHAPLGAITVRGVRMDRRRVSALASGLGPGGVFLLWTGEGLGAKYSDLLDGAGLRTSFSPLKPEGGVLLRGVRS